MSNRNNGRNPVASSSRKKITLKRKRFFKNQQFLNSFNVPLTNQFNLLNEEDANEKEEDISMSVPKVKVSPIVVTDVSIDTKQTIDELNIVCDIKLMSVGRKIFPKSLDDKQKIMAAFAEKNVNFFSHPDNYGKTFKAVLTGLPAIETNIIIECLKTNYNISTTKVTMFLTNSDSKMYLCEFESGAVNMKTLNNIKSVHHHIIKWQPYKPKRRGPTQCYRCLMYGHGAKSCNRYAACGQCGGNHLTNNCLVITNTTVNPIFKCFNCVSAKLPHDHKATDASCPFRAKYVATKENTHRKGKRVNSSNQNNVKNNVVPAPAPPPLLQSFANVMHTQQQPASTSTTTQNSNTNTFSAQSNTNNCDGLWSFSEVAQILVNSVNQLKQCKTKFDQLLVIASLLENACN